MFEKPRIIIVLLFSICIIYSQNYRSVDEIKDDWVEHSNFQKQELLSFCDFLINGEHYERALLSLFQYLYKFPSDSLEIPILYHIARSYDLSGNQALANRYYDEVINLTDENDRIYRAAYYRKLLIKYYQEDYDTILEETENETDPYLITLRGYIFLNDLEWVAARQAFLSANERFSHRHYSSLIAPIMQTIDNAAEVPMKNKWQTLTASIFPGGGRAYLQEWGNAGGALVSFLLVASLASTKTDLNQSGDLSFTDNRNELIPQGAGYQLDANQLPNNPSSYGLPDNVRLSSKNKYLIYTPAVLSLSIYLGTILKTYQDVDSANQLLFRNHIRESMDETPIDSFMDFMEPNLINN